MPRTTLEDLAFEYSCFEDDWGEAMCAWFAVAAELHFRNPALVPADWEYVPSPLTPVDPREPDDYWFGLLGQVSNKDLLAFGKFLDFHAARLVMEGRDY